MKRNLFYIFNFLFFLILISPSEMSATHIVGGEMRYRCLGGNYFRIYLTVRRDCFNGAPDAQFDDPAFITAYGLNGDVLEEIGQNGVISIKYNQDDTLNEVLTSTCKVFGPDVCVHTTTYFTDVELRPRTGGYTFVYQRCCYNSTLVNIQNPLQTGMTLFVTITEEALRVCNTSPDFLQWPSIYLCQGDTFSFDHSARDVNRDSLVYTLCTPYKGASITIAKPTRASAPPYDTVVWRAPYNLKNLMGGFPLQVNSRTGLMTAAPNTIGQFLIGVCLEEYRNGKLLSKSRRVFEYNVLECPERPIADFNTEGVICEGLTVDFMNTSSGDNFEWHFDWDNNPGIMSRDSSPSYTYPAPGKYTVALFAIRDSTCRDSVYKEVIVYGDGNYKADFDFHIDECEEEIVVRLEDQSFDSLYSISGVEWIIESKDSTRHYDMKNLSLVFTMDDTLKVTLIATTEYGCTDTLVQMIPIHILDVDFLGNRISICEGDTTPLINTPKPKFTYQWSPSNTLSCSDCPDPLAFPSTSTMYVVTVTDGLCSVLDTVNVTVNENLVVEIIGDSIACQKDVTLIIPSGVPANTVWARDAMFGDTIRTGVNRITVQVDSVRTIYVMSSTTEDCLGMDSITITRQEVFYEVDSVLRYCVNDTFEVNVENLIDHHQLNFSWTPTDRIVSGQGSANPRFHFPNPGKHTIHFGVINQFGCSKSGEINLTIEALPVVDFDVDKNCDTLLVHFLNSSDMGSYIWHFGDGDTSHLPNPSHLYKAPGFYEVILEVHGFCSNQQYKEVSVGQIYATPPDTIISCKGESVSLYPMADTNLIYAWSPARFLNDPSLPNPTANPSQTTRFKVTITDTTYEDCSIEREVLVLVTNEVDFNLTTLDTVLCYDDTLTLTAKGGYGFCWFFENGDTIALDTEQITIVVTNDASIRVVGKDQYNCEGEKYIKVHRFNYDVTISTPDTICFTESTELMVTNNGEGPLTYNWSPKQYIIDGETTSSPLVSPNRTTDFVVTITTARGCVYYDTATVFVEFVDPRPQVTTNRDTVYLTQSAQLDVIGGPYTSYSWSPRYALSCTDCPNPRATPDQTTTYRVLVTNERGCLDSAFITIVVVNPNCDASDVFIPNAFSPNGDNINDVWRYRSNFVDLVEVVVYNRWGERVFESTDVNFAWDGTKDGEFLEPDVYAYYIKVICIDESEYEAKGNVTLLR